MMKQYLNNLMPVVLAVILMPVVLAVIFLVGCTREQLTTSCDTLNMSYSKNVVPILKSSCYKCHSAGNSVGSYAILLDSHFGLVKYVESHNPKNTRLGKVIEHQLDVPPMPYMNEKLDTCAIKQIEAWITDGALDN